MKVLFYISHLFKRVIRKVLDIFNDLACKNNVTYGKNTKFKSTAKVENLSQNKANITIGKHSIIRGELFTFRNGGKIYIGDYCYLGEQSKIWSGNEVIIGNNVLISHNVNIIDTNSHEENHIERAKGFERLLKYGHPHEKTCIVTSPIRIEDFAWINFGAAILKGVTIGTGAIVAANAVVTKDVPSFTLVAGNPAVVIKHLEK